MIKKNHRLSFLMSSCDSYEDLWRPFFECIGKYWADISYPLFLNTEFKQFDGVGNLNVTTINQLKPGKMSWSARFRDVLLRIPSDYVFLVLDDFFLCDYVDDTFIERLLDEMDKDKSIPSIQLNGTRMILSGEPDRNDGGITIKSLWSKGWATHFVPTIWRKEVLLKWLRPWESIWGFEGYGSDRARRRHLTQTVKVVCAPPIYKYLWVKDCSAVVHGKWLDEPGVLGFFADNGIELDFNARSTISYEEYRKEGMSAQLKKYSLGEIIIKSFNRLRSYF